MFQYSHLSRLDHTISESWTTESSMEYWTMVDSLGNRSRIAQISINNPLNNKERIYSVMQRVRILDSYGIIAFLGRIISITPSFSDHRIILTCRDYLGELSDRVILAESGDGKYTAASRNGLLSKLVEEESEEPEVGQDMNRTLLPRMLQDTGNYLESITKTYSIRGMYGLNPSTRTASNYNYRGATTVLEALSQVSAEDAQQDLQVFYYTDTPVDPASDAYLADSKRFPSTYWVDHTGGIGDGTEVFSTPRHVVNAKSVYGTTTGTPDKEADFPSTEDVTQQNDIIYFGSNSKFDGIEYTFRQSGGKIHESNYDELEWQYWDGKHWTRFVPDYDTKFKADSRETETVTGRAYWSSLISDTSMTNTAAGKNTPTAVSTQLDGALSVNTVPFSVEEIVVDSSANLSVGGLIQIGANDTITETMRIISINGNTLTVYRNYPGTANESNNAHVDNSKVIGGHRQGMADWAKRDLAQSADMHSYSDGNTSQGGDGAVTTGIHTDNAKWKAWKTPFASSKVFDNFRIPPGTAQLTTYDGPYPTGNPVAHGLRSGDKLKGTNFTGWEYASRSHLHADSTGYPYHVGARAYPHSAGRLDLAVQIPADRTDTMLIVSVMEFVKVNGIATTSFEAGSGYARFGTYNPATQSMVSYAQMNTVGGYNSHHNNNNFIAWSQSYNSGADWTPAFTFSSIKSFYVMNPEPGEKVISVYPGSGGDGIGTYYGFNIMSSLFSGVDTGTAPTIATDYRAADYQYTIDGEEPSISLTTAPGDWVYNAWLYSKPRIGGASTQTSSFNSLSDDDMTYNQGSGQQSDGVTHQGLWNMESGIRHGTWSFRFGHKVASTTGTTTTSNLTVYNGGGTNLGTHKYKFNGHSIRIKNKYPGGSVGEAGFLNGLNYVEVLSPYTVNLWDHYKGANDGTDTFGNFDNSSNIFITYPLPFNNGSIDVTEKSGASATETILEVGGSVRTDDVTSSAIPSMNIGEGRGTYKYWVRAFVRKSASYGYLNNTGGNSAGSLVVDVERHPHVNHTTIDNALDFSEGQVITSRDEDMFITSISGTTQLNVTRGYNGTTATAQVHGDAINGTIPAQLATVSLYTAPETFRDFRAEDPKPFDEIWRYSSNIESTTLAEDLTNSETAIDVTSAASFALDDVITINSEDMLITGISSNTLTVTRGFGETTATTHDNGDAVSVSLFSESNHDMTGGDWLSLNKTGGNTGSGSVLLWSDAGNTANALEDNTYTLYLGSEEPFNGVEFTAQQGAILQAVSITQASPAVLTTGVDHNLTTGDYVVITGSNSGVSVDGYRQVTVISATTFSVVVNNSGVAGTAATIFTGVPDYSNVSFKFDVLDTFPRNYWGASTDGRTDSTTAWRTIQVQNDNYNDLSWSARSNVGSLTSIFPAGPFGPARWRYDGGQLSAGTLNWTNEVRFNTDKPRNDQALKDTSLNPDRILPPVNPPRTLAAAEYDLAYQMSNSEAWSTRASLVGPYSSHSMGTGARATHNNASTASMYASTTAYVGSTTDVTMTFTTAHHCAVGDYIIFTNAAGNELDGAYRVKTVTSRYILTFDCGRTGLSFSSNDTLEMKRVSSPPNTKSLYWMRVRISGAARTPMALRHVRMANNARFKYFDRGKEPWPANRTVSPRGSAANEDLDAVYTYDASGGFASSNTTINAAMNSSQTTLTMANNINIDPGMTIKIDSEEIFITSDGNPMNCVRGVNGTTAAAHSSGASVYQSSAFIYSSQASLGYTEFTTGYSTGYPIVHGLSVGDMVQITPNVYADTDSTSRTDSDHNDGFWKVDRVPSTTTFVINKFFVSGWSSADKHLVHFTKFKDITPNLVSDSVDTKALTIASSGTGQPGTIRTDQEHEFRSDDVVIFAGTSSSPPTSNVYRVNEVVSADEFTYKQEDGTFVNVTSALTDTGTVRSYTAISKCEAADAGKITTTNPHNLKEGQTITIVGTSISSLNTTTHVKEIISARVFTVSIDIASTGTANQGYITTDPVTIPSAVGDALYFGWHSPFTQLRIDSLTSSLADGGLGAGVWEYYRADNFGLSPIWSALDVNDLSGGFKGYSIDSDHEISFFAPGFGFWKSCKAGVTDPSTQTDGYQIQHLNKTFGNQYYFVRYRFTTAAASAISLSRVWCGPYVWNAGLETNTISGSTNKRHATDLLAYGINLDDREITQNEGSNVRVTSYELKDNAIEFVNVVTVRGIAGAYATARNEDSIRKFRVVKEKVIDDTSLVNDIQCMQRAKSALEQLGASSPIDILDITAAKPSVVTTGGTYKYLYYSDNNNPMNVTLFENKGLEITGNSAENNNHTTALDGAINNSVGSITVDSTADFIVGHVILVGAEQMLITGIPSSTVLTVERNANGTTSTSHVDNLEVYIFNRTYITTGTAHNLNTGDRVLITDVSNTAPRFQGIGSFSADNPMSYNYVHKIVVTGQKQFYVQTADSVLTGTGALAHQLSVLNTSPDPDTTTVLDNSFDAVGSVVHPMASTDLSVGDSIKLLAGVHTATNSVLSTVSQVLNEGSTVQLEGIGAGTTPTDLLGYAYISENHNLQTGDSIRIKGTNSVPSIDGYRTITRLTDKTFSINADLSSGTAGSDGVLLPTSIREATIKIDAFPVFTAGSGMPKVLRAGDLVNVSLYNAGIVHESWLVYSIITGAINGGVELTLFRDLSAVSEPGDAEKQLLRDLSSHLRETANAVFQPIDKAVEKALDFLPEGPSRPSVRMEMGPTNLANSIDVPSPGLIAGTHTQTFPDDFRLSWKMYENFPTRETVDKDLLRIDMQGLRADDTGDASGGAGITFIGRDKVTGNSGSTPNFHPNDGEATLYLRDSDTANEGRGLYLAHRGIFNSADTYDEWDTDTPKLQSEVFVGLSGRVTCNSGGTATITLPALTSNPRIMATSESAGFVHITPFTVSSGNTTTVTLTVRDSGGTTINGAVINYIVVYNSSSNVGGLNSHY